MQTYSHNSILPSSQRHGWTIPPATKGRTQGLPYQHKLDGVPPFRPPRHPCFYQRRHWAYTCRAAVWHHADPTWSNGCTHHTTQCSGSDELRTSLTRVHVTSITHTSTSTESKNTCPFGHQPMDSCICAQRRSINASSTIIFWSLPGTPEARQIFHTGH